MVQYQCPRCGHIFVMQYPVSTAHCPACGQAFQPSPMEPGLQEPGVFDAGPSGKSRGVAALLAILLGSLGVHYFYLEKVGAGLLCILLTCVTCGIFSVIPLVQGVIMLTMRQDAFERKYVNTTSFFPLF